MSGAKDIELISGKMESENYLRAIPDISNTVLTSTLKALENQGLVLRQQFNEVPPHVEYSLTESAKALDKVFQTMREWGNRYL